jgi:hypothetical protein
VRSAPCNFLFFLAATRIWTRKCNADYNDGQLEIEVHWAEQADQLTPLPNGMTMYEMAASQANGVTMDGTKTLVRVENFMWKTHLIFGSVTQAELESDRWVDLVDPDFVSVPGYLHIIIESNIIRANQEIYNESEDDE